jgi:hypothetical protein
MSDADTDGDPRDASTHTQFRIRNETHSRITTHQREAETLGATVERALDALEREQDLPAAVRQALRADDGAHHAAPNNDNGDPVFEGG